MLGRARPVAVRRPTRIGVSVQSRRAAGRGQSWPEWGQASAAVSAAQDQAERLSSRSRDRKKITLKELVTHHYLPSIRDTAPNTRMDDRTERGPAVDHDERQTVAAQDDPAVRGGPRCGCFWLGDTGGHDVVVIVDRFGSVLDRPGPARQSHIGPASG